MPKDPYQIQRLLTTKNGTFTYYSLAELENQGHNINKLPFSIRILLENALRNFDNFAVTEEDIKTILAWQPAGSDKDIPFKPGRVLMQDFTGVPAVVSSIFVIRARSMEEAAEIARKCPVYEMNGSVEVRAIEQFCKLSEERLLFPVFFAGLSFLLSVLEKDYHQIALLMVRGRNNRARPNKRIAG